MYLERHQAVDIPVKPFGGKIFAPVLLEIFDEVYQYINAGPLEGKFLQTTCSPVLCMPTIWQKDYEHNKYFVYPADVYANAQATSTVALFPSLQELKFEGNDRIASKDIHRRFFPAPRYPCNQTMNWTVRPYLKPHEFDEIMENHIPTEEEILTYDWEIGLPNDEDLQIGLPVPDKKENGDLEDTTKTKNDSVEDTTKTENNDADGTTNEDPYDGCKATRLLGHDLSAALDPQNAYF